MDKQEIIESLVYDTVVAAIRAEVDRDAAQAVLDVAAALATQTNLAAELMASSFGLDIAELRDRATKQAAI